MFRHHTMRLLLGLLALLLAAAAPAGTRVTYYHLDAAGTPVAATDQNGELLWRTGHLPYGQPTGAIPGRIGYAGHVVDDTGLIYMGARYYDPVAGRFMGMDPAGFDETNPQSFNRYQYANNNPYRYVDPDGESPIDVFFLAADMIKLGAAIYSGNASAVVESSLDVAASVVGVLSPVPGVGQAIKAGRRASSSVKLIEPGVNITPRRVANKYRYLGQGNRTFVTDVSAVERVIGAISGPRKVISSSDARRLERAIGLRPNSLERTNIMSVVEDIAGRSPASPVRGNQQFLGGGVGLPGGGRELTIQGIPSAGGPGISQKILEIR